MEMTLDHLWQTQNLGTAPFQAIAIISVPSKGLLESGNVAGYNNAMAEATIDARRFGVALCSCQSCGQSLQNNVIIRDAKDKHFVVGMDCARKTGDAKLITKAEALEKERLRQVKAAKDLAERDAREARIAADHAAQRERNGGLTDYELAAKKAKEAEAAKVAEMSAANGWLISVLENAGNGDFISSMIAQLQTRKLSYDNFSPRCVNILADIYAKQIGGRKGSKKYLAAEGDFFAKAGIEI